MFFISVFKRKIPFVVIFCLGTAQTGFFSRQSRLLAFLRLGRVFGFSSSVTSKLAFLRTARRYTRHVKLAGHENKKKKKNNNNPRIQAAPEHGKINKVHGYLLELKRQLFELLRMRKLNISVYTDHVKLSDHENEKRFNNPRIQAASRHGKINKDYG